MGRSGGGGGGGGFSGGGHSSGGFSGGGHSSGGFSGGGGGRSGGGGGGGFGGPRGGFGGPAGGPPGPPPGGGFGRVHVPTFIPVPIPVNRSTGGGGGGPESPRGGGNSGCGTALVVIAVIFVVLLLLGGLGSCTSCSGVAAEASVSASTVEREALPASASEDVGWYTDADGDWIHDASKLESGLKEFYDETGVRPYVYILPNGATASVTELSERADALYDELFTDTGHFLLVFCDDTQGSYNCGYAVGTQAATVMDDEAVQILRQYLDLYYNDYSISEEEIFSKAFADTADRIMHVTTSPVVPVAICAAVVVAGGVVVFVVRKRREEKDAERKHVEEVLKTPLEKFGDKDVEDLAKKYEDGK